MAITERETNTLNREQLIALAKKVDERAEKLEKYTVNMIEEPSIYGPLPLRAISREAFLGKLAFATAALLIAAGELDRDILLPESSILLDLSSVTNIEPIVFDHQKKKRLELKALFPWNKQIDDSGCSTVLPNRPAKNWEVMK